MTARLLPSRRPSHVTPLEAAAYDVIDDVLDVLQQAEDRAADAADVAEARLSLDRHLATFTALAAKTQAAKDAENAKRGPRDTTIFPSRR